MGCIRRLLPVGLAFVAASMVWAAEPGSDSSVQSVADRRLAVSKALETVQNMILPFRESRQGKLPADFLVRISMRSMLDSKKQAAVSEVYEFTEKQVTRYRPGTNSESDVFEKDKQAPCTRVDQVCRVLLAMDYADLVRAAMNGTGPSNDVAVVDSLQVMDGAGLCASGACDIEVRCHGQSVSCGSNCLTVSGFNSAQSLRFSALYHTLRRLARSDLGLAPNDWADAVWK